MLSFGASLLRRTFSGLTVQAKMASTMRAIRVHQFGGPEVLKLEEVPVPRNGDKEVLIRVHSVGVNPVETYIRSGTYTLKPPLPYTPGTDAAGVVEAVGVGVTKFKVGDRVFTTRKPPGSYAEYAVCPDDACWILPQRLSFSQGAGIGIPYFTAYRALFQRARVHPSQSLLVHGASGAVGLAAIQLARSFGMTVYGTAGTETGLKLVKDNGAQFVFNHRKAGYLDEMVKSTNGQGFDVILEMLANVNLNTDCNLLKMFGSIVVIGSRGNIEINPRTLMAKDAQIYAMGLKNASDQNFVDMGAAITAGLENGTLTPVVDREYRLEEAAHAHKDIIESSGAKGNLVLKIRD